MTSSFEASSGMRTILFNSAQASSDECALCGERICIVTTTAGTKKITVTLTHMKAAANYWSWSGEIFKSRGAER